MESREMLGDEQRDAGGEQRDPGGKQRDAVI